jgi:hypothetical protein
VLNFPCFDRTPEPQRFPVMAAAAPSPPTPGPQGAPTSQTPTKFATNPKTGERVGLINNKWVPISGGRPTGNDPLSQARDAIARGADPAAVKKRLLENSIDPTGL